MNRHLELAFVVRNPRELSRSDELDCRPLMLVSEDTGTAASSTPADEVCHKRDDPPALHDLPYLLLFPLVNWAPVIDKPFDACAVAVVFSMGLKLVIVGTGLGLFSTLASDDQGAAVKELRVV